MFKSNKIFLLSSIFYLFYVESSNVIKLFKNNAKQFNSATLNSKEVHYVVSNVNDKQTENTQIPADTSCAYKWNTNLAYVPINVRGLTIIQNR